MNELIIAPSMLSLHFDDATHDLDELVKSAAKWLHFDVMDGHFVPNITFGADVLKGFKKRTKLFMDVHLMITNPAQFIPEFVKNGADMITFHYEAINDIEQCIQILSQIRDLNCQCGLVLKPATDVKVLKRALPYVDMILIMSVEPGFGGQAFQPSSLDKIVYLNEQRKKHHFNYRIEIDGGINNETAKLAIAAGCDTLVAGSYIFKQDIIQGVNSLLCLK